MQLIKYCICCSLIEQINGWLPLKGMFIALNSRRIRSIFALNYFKPGVNDRCIKKLKTCKTSFYVKKEKVKALKRSVPFYFFFLFHSICAVFMSRKFSPALQVQERKRLETLHFFILKANTPFLHLF